jgi:hypothetical protein
MLYRSKDKCFKLQQLVLCFYSFHFESCSKKMIRWKEYVDPYISQESTGLGSFRQGLTEEQKLYTRNIQKPFPRRVALPALYSKSQSSKRRWTPIHMHLFPNCVFLPSCGNLAKFLCPQNVQCSNVRETCVDMQQGLNCIEHVWWRQCRELPCPEVLSLSVTVFT